MTPIKLVLIPALPSPDCSPIHTSSIARSANSRLSATTSSLQALSTSSYLRDTKPSPTTTRASTNPSSILSPVEKINAAPQPPPQARKR